MPSFSKSTRPAPLARGLPLLGYLPQFMHDPLAICRALERRHGLAFRTHIMIDVTVLLGPDANQFVLQNRDGIFSSQGGWAYFIDAVFPGAIMSMDDPGHRLQRRIMQQAFKQPALQRYLDHMQPVITERLAPWQSSSKLLAYPTIKKLTLDLATSVFVGEAIGPEAARVNQAFVDTVEASLALLRQPIPPFGMWRGLRGRATLVDYFQQLMAKKRASDSPDFFSQFCHARDEDGHQFSDQEVIDHMIFLMMAAHDTTTSTLTSLLFALAEQPHWQARLREESLALDEHLGFDELAQLPSLDLCIKEALRMYPPLTSMPRQASVDCEFQGHFIAKGSRVGVFPLHTHFMDAYWSHPFRFDPERFARGEHKQHMFQYVPFGGGAHMCLGQHFANLQIKAIMHQLLRSFSWSLPAGYALRNQMVPIIKPRDGLPLLWLRLR